MRSVSKARAELPATPEQAAQMGSQERTGLTMRNPERKVRLDIGLQSSPTAQSIYVAISIFRVNGQVMVAEEG